MESLSLLCLIALALMSIRTSPLFNRSKQQLSERSNDRPALFPWKLELSSVVFDSMIVIPSPWNELNRPQVVDSRFPEKKRPL